MDVSSQIKELEERAKQVGALKLLRLLSVGGTRSPAQRQRQPKLNWHACICQQRQSALHSLLEPLLQLNWRLHMVFGPVNAAALLSEVRWHACGQLRTP